jgi:hypothetical protein
MEMSSPKVAGNSTPDRKPDGGEIVLNVVSTDGEVSIGLLKALMKSAKPAPKIVSHPTLDDALKSGAKLPVLIMVAGAEIAICNAVNGGKTPSAALENWKRQSGELLKRFRKVRRNILLIEQGALQFRPKDCVDTLGKRLGLQFGALSAKGADEALSPREKGLVLLVRALLLRDSEAQTMAEEFEALAVSGTFERAIDGMLIDDVFTALEERELLLKHLELFQSALPEPGSGRSADKEQAKYENALLSLALKDGLTIGRQKRVEFSFKK